MKNHTLLFALAAAAGLTPICVNGQSLAESTLTSLNAHMQPGLWEIEVSAANEDTLIQKVCVTPQEATDIVASLPLTPSDAKDCVFTRQTLQNGVIDAEAMCTHDGQTTKMTVRGAYTSKTFQINIDPDADANEMPTSLSAISTKGHHANQDCS